jgi:hypothetical protein
MTEWQPIETAPRDGTVILACNDDIAGTVRFKDFEWEFAFAYVSHKTESSGFNAGFYPTLWMPIPENPKTESL